MNKEINTLMALVQDKNIVPDAWADTFLDTALEYAKKIHQAGLLKDLLEKISSVQGESKTRLIQVISELHDPEMFESLFALIKEADLDTGEILIDSLCRLSLTEVQKKRLAEAAKPFREKSPLLDQVLKHFLENLPLLQKQA